MFPQEPYFDLDLIPCNGGGGGWSKDDEIIWNQNRRQGSKHEFFKTAFEFISENNIIGDYHEFGIHKCRTFRMAMLEAKRHLLNSINFFAYDSFVGLPLANDDNGIDKWNKSSLSTSKDEFFQLLIKSGFDTNNVSCFEGFYDTSLPNISIDSEFCGSKASLVTIDCDLYESSVPVFRYIDNLLQEGTVLYIDDYFTGYKGNPLKGVSRAFNEWACYTRWRICPYRDVGWGGQSYIIYS